ncbi:MAG: hypothetical protein ACUVT1_04300, partial [Anaerolineae bacterium]
YLQRMYEAGIAPWVDILAAHAYGWVYPPEDPPDPEVVNFRRVELLRDIMRQYGDGHKSIIITEAGWNDHPRWSKAVRPAQRATYTIAAYEWALQQWDWCPAVVMWAFRFPRPARTYQDYFTFVSDDFYPKPIYWEVQRYAQTGQP